MRPENGPSTSWFTAACPMTWLTPYSGLFRPIASAFAADAPIVSGPTRPGPAVTAIASTSDRSTSASPSARVIVGTICSRWARLATSGMIPP